MCTSTPSNPASLALIAPCLKSFTIFLISATSKARGVLMSVGFQSAVNVPLFLAAIAEGATGNFPSG